MALPIVWPVLLRVLALLLAPIPAAAQAPTDSPSNVKPTVRVDWNPRPSLRFGDVFRIDLRLKVQTDWRAFLPDQPTENGTFELHRRRIAVEGRLFSRIEYQIERELQEGGPWRDVYVNARVGNPFEVRVGKFKIPFGLEETTNTMELDFIYRTRGSDELAPARHKGVMAHGRLGRLLEYEFGGFTGDGDNARVWDSDNTFHASDFAITSGHEQNVLMRRAMLVPELRALYFSALAEAAALAMEPVVGAGMGWLEWDIVRQRDLTAQAMQLDPVKPFTNEQVAVAMDEMVAFARGRAAFVMCQAAILTGTMNPLCVVP